jgi:hypothetical protein
MFAHPLRYAEMERRLAKDEKRKRQRDLLEAKLDLASAELRVKRANRNPDDQAEDSDGKAWRMAARDLVDFYNQTAKSYGLLGPVPGPASEPTDAVDRAGG